MKIKSDNSEIDIIIKETDSDLGLIDDKWCVVKVVLKNDNFSYTVENELNTKNEFIRGINKIEKFYNGETSIHERIKFIKNYFIIDFFIDKEKNKILNLKMVAIDDTRSYTLKFVNDEIKGFIDMIRRAEFFN